MDAIIIGKKLKSARIEKKKSLSEVSRDLSASRSALAMYETGRRIPRDDMKIKLAAYYGQTVDSLFFADSVT